jgi:ABC-type multidrug transport system fused ATPase/permease subunit
MQTLKKTSLSMSESILQHQKKLLADLRTLIRETTTGERELLKRLEANTETAEQKRAGLLTVCQQSFAKKREKATATKETAIDKIEERRELEPQVLEDKHEQRVFEINSSAEEIIEQNESKLNEAIWLAESVYEGAIAGPRENAQEALNALEETKEKLDALCEEAPRTLSRFRHTPTQTEGNEHTKVERSMESYTIDAEQALDAMQSDPKAKWFVGIRPAIIVLMVTGATVAATGSFTRWDLGYPIFTFPSIAFIVTSFTLWGTYVSGVNSVRQKLTLFRESVSLAKAAYESSVVAINQQRRHKEKAVTTNRDVEIKKAENKYKPKLEEIERLTKKDLQKEKDKFASVADKLAAKIEQDTTDTLTTFESTMEELESQEASTLQDIENEYTKTNTSIEKDQHDTMELLTKRWHEHISAMSTDCNGQIATNQMEHPAWESDWKTWDPQTISTHTIPIGHFTIDLTAIAGVLPTSDALQLPAESVISIPLCATLPRDTSMLISSTGKHRDASIAFLQNAILRVLTSIPPGKAKFTLIDPVGLGQSFASVLHLADYEESQLLDRAWTEPRHIETQLARLTEHMETVIQKYLRNEFESIDAYNEQAGEIAEPYRFLVIADLPNNFSEHAAKRLASIITSGARCGVHVIIHRDVSLSLPAGLDEDTLNRIPLRIVEDDGTFCIDEDELRELPLEIEQPPNESVATSIVKQVGETADNTHRVEVPFSVISPQQDEIWSMSTTNKVVVPLGRSGATKLQNLTLGRGTAQHALIAGKTGSGKSTLLHVLITNLALWYSPDEIEFYLVDFKKGVEFKTYATNKLPHARVVAVESDREFGISVLQKIDRELKRRGELFRDQGVQDIAGFREKNTNPMPRILLIIDEFQEFFVDDDRIAQEANLLLDRLVRQGRAFGIHAIMGSQTLDGAYTLSRSTMGQMAIRVALQCSEQDSYIILNEDNAAARLLSRPGEAIYNDAAGNVEGNSPFQIVWLDDKEREVLLHDLVKRDNGKEREMVVYEGNQPMYLCDNTAFQNASNEAKTLSAHAWLGGAMAIKEDTAATFRATSASNLLIVGQQDETTSGMIASTLLSLDKQYAPGSVSFKLLDGTPKDSSHANMLSDVQITMAHDVSTVGVRQVEEAMAEIDIELQKRMKSDKTDGVTMFLIINALHRFRDLRRDEDDYGFSMGDEAKTKSPAQVLAELLKEGPPLGMHVIVSTDTLANLNRTFDRQSLREFDMRVLLQMGANDSTNLIDMPDASRLGMHRALLYSEETGTIEPFRPYAPPA